MIYLIILIYALITVLIMNLFIFVYNYKEIIRLRNTWNSIKKHGVVYLHKQILISRFEFIIFAYYDIYNKKIGLVTKRSDCIEFEKAPSFLPYRKFNPLNIITFSYFFYYIKIFNYLEKSIIVLGDEYRIDMNDFFTNEQIMKIHDKKINIFERKIKIDGLLSNI